MITEVDLLSKGRGSIASHLEVVAIAVATVAEKELIRYLTTVFLSVICWANNYI